MTLRRAMVWGLRALAMVVGLVTAVILHLPAPSGVSSEARAPVRGVWTTAGAIAERLPDVPDVFDVFFSDKTIHFAVFFALAWLWAAARALDRTLDRRGALWIAGVLTVYAGVGELAQMLEGRIAEVGDWIANVLGTLAGLGMVLTIARLRRALRARSANSTPGRQDASTAVVSAFPSRRS